jgi:hypothetical protein
MLTLPTLFFLPRLAQADPSFTLSPTSTMGNPLIANPGQTLTFKGLLTDNDGDGIVITGDTWNIPYTGITLNDSAFQTNFVDVAFGGNPGDTYPTNGQPAKIFDLTFSTSVKPALYNMTFTAEVTDATTNVPFNLTERFFVRVPAPAPAPGSLVIALLGAAGIGTSLAGKRHRLLKHSKFLGTTGNQASFTYGGALRG